MTRMYALIIDGSYCGQNTIYGVYESLYDAVIAARDWIDDKIPDKEIQSVITEFVENDFLRVDGYFNIDDFEF